MKTKDNVQNVSSKNTTRAALRGALGIKFIVLNVHFFRYMSA